MNAHAQPQADALANLELEADLLGSLMTDNRGIDQAADILAAHDFAEPLHGRIFDVLVDHAARGKAANPVTIKGYFDDDPAIKVLGGVSYLMGLTASVMGLRAAETAREIAGLAQRRRMRDGLSATALDCSDLSLPVAEIVSRADDAVNATARDTIHQPTGAECFAELMAGFGESQSGVTCGQIPSLDELVGPMRPKQLVICAARPGMGKTALALSYAIGAAQNGHGVLFVSLEMSSRELAGRMAADMCFDGRDGVPFNAIRDGRLNDWQMRRVAEASSRMAGYPLNVIDAGYLNTGRLSMLIRRHARRMQAMGRKLELVVVDYLQLLSPDSKGRSNYEAVSEVSRALKAMAKDQDVAIMALAQLSRAVETRPDKRPQLSDLRDSGQIEQDADAVFFLLRPEYYLRQAEPDQMAPERFDWERALADVQGRLEFILAKRRNGVTGQASAEFHGGYQAVRG